MDHTPEKNVGNDDDNGINDDDDDNAPDGEEEEGSPLFAAQALGEENLVENFLSILSLSILSILALAGKFSSHTFTF